MIIGGKRINEEQIQREIQEQIKKSQYLNLAKSYGGLKCILFSPDFVIAFILTVIICYYYFGLDNFPKVIEQIILAIIGGDAGLLGIVLAGYALIISMAQGPFIRFLVEQEIMNDIIFLFTHSSLMISIGLISSILLAMLIPLDFFAKFLFTTTIFFTFYGILTIISLLFDMKKYAFLRGLFSKIER